MKRLQAVLCGIVLLLTTGAAAQQIVPIRERVNVQMDTARMEQVVDGRWVGVGTRAEHAISHDYTLLYQGLPSYRFELREEDNTLEGYAPGSTKGRTELSHCYATAADFASLTPYDYHAAQRMKTVYHHGKGIIPQGATSRHRFALYVPEELSEEVTTIFAQWHGMPDRRLVQSPDGEIKMLTTEEFLELESRMRFKKNKGYDRLEGVDKRGNPRYSKEWNGWLVEQGGFPPLAFGFSKGLFYIKCNSDRRWMTDKTDRTSASLRGPVLVAAESEYLSSLIAYKMPFQEFPKGRWVEFTVEITWSLYGGQSEEILRRGSLDVKMTYDGEEHHIVKHEPLNIGRNDDEGYYFKFGIYRVADSTVPVCYNLAGYEEEVL